MKLVKACIAMAAVAALFVVPSIASATSPELFETTAGGSNDLVPVGTKIIATNVAHSNTPTQTVLTTSAGTVVCGKATLTGTVTKNGGGIEGNIETAEFAGTHGVTTTGHCSGNLAIGEKITPTPNHTNNPCHKATIESPNHCSLPWCVKAVTEHTFTVRGATCSEEPRPLTFTLHGTIECKYEKASVTGTYTTHPADATLTIAEQEFKRNSTSSAFCPASGKLTMAFTITTDTPEGVSGPPLNIT